MFVPYASGAGLAHRLSPGTKLVLLALAGTGLFFIDNAGVMALLAGAALGLFPLCGLPLRLAWDQLRPIRLLMAIIILAQVVLADVPSATLVGARLIALVVLAGLVSLTTRTSAMIEALESALRPLAKLGVSPQKCALALSLSVRLVPLLAQIVAEVREAQRVRGLEHNIFATAIPVLTRALALTDTLADAIEARAFEPEETRP